MRQSIINYAYDVAKIVSTRSQDPYRQVGAVILDNDNRIISTGYNGLAPGFDPPSDSFWADKEKRKPFMIHAEINALSYIKRNEGKILVSTLKPCPNCLLACIAHGIKSIWYGETKDGLEQSDKIAETYGIRFNSIFNND
jgi:dCMP deaminase